MKVITAPNKVDYVGGKIVCFLAGGITGVPNWQYKVIKYLEEKPGTERLVLINPRREEWPSDPEEVRRQIEGEFEFLNFCDIFSVYFSGGDSVQPITLYELGRQLALRNLRPWDIVISVGEGYKRETDVVIQSELALGGLDLVKVNRTPKQHADDIYRRYLMHENRTNQIYKNGCADKF